MSHFSNCVDARRKSVNKKIDAFENNTPEIVRNYLKELGGIALYNAVFGNPQNYYEYKGLQRAIAFDGISEEGSVDAYTRECLCYAEYIRNRKNNRENFLKEQYKILFDLNTVASHKAFEQILAHDNEWNIATRELCSEANAVAKHIFHDMCYLRGYHFD